MSGKTKIALIVGPTASGKTAVGVECAIRLNGEVISADSIQIYKGLDIGSAKPTKAEMRGIPHHLMDFYDVDAPKFSAAEYQRRAAACIEDIFSRGKLPIIVGGTGLYVNSLVFPLDFTSTPADEEYRRELTELEARDPGSLYSMLRERSPDTAKRLHRNDTKRLIRALEVLKHTGDTTGGDFANSKGRDIPYEPLMIGLTMPRELLYERIDRRVDGMMSAGLLKEVDVLLARGCDPELPALQGLGYKQLILYRRGVYGLDEAISAIKQETRRFAKRQLTWFRRDSRIHWLDMTKYSVTDAADEIVRLTDGEGD